MTLRSLLMLCLSIGVLRAAPAGSNPTELKLAHVRNSPPALYAFLLKMPKGADLHNHLSGAVYAESYMREAAKAGLCIDLQTLAYTAPSTGASHCKPEQVNAAEAETNVTLANKMLDSLSMRDFVPGRES